jgi:hypothetical protein
MRMILAAVACCVLPALSATAQMPPPGAVFTAIKPCRAFNTAPTGKMTGATYRTFQVGGSWFGQPQGGPTMGCGVPLSATAVAISLTVIGAPSAAYASAFP